MNNKFKKTILIDLDGVLNTYDGKYDKNHIPSIKDGARELLLDVLIEKKILKDLNEIYRVVIFTSRNLYLASKWVVENSLDEFISDVTNIKEPSYLIIDDRCEKFEGDYQELRNKIDNFKVWYK